MISDYQKRRLLYMQTCGTVVRMKRITKGGKWYNAWLPDTPKWWRQNKWRRWDKKYRNEPRHKYKKNALRRKESENLPF